MNNITVLYLFLDSGADISLSKSENLLGTVEFELKTKVTHKREAKNMSPHREGESRIRQEARYGA